MSAGSAVAKLYNAISDSHKIRKVVAYCSPILTVKLTRQHRDKRARSHTYVLTLGKPNYAERQWLKKNKPTGQIKLFLYPEKKKAK